MDGLVKTSVARKPLQKVEFWLPRRSVERFRKIMPMQGSLTWFVRMALEEFIAEISDLPENAIARTVRQVVADARVGRTVRLAGRK